MAPKRSPRWAMLQRMARRPARTPPPGGGTVTISSALSKTWATGSVPRSGHVSRAMMPIDDSARIREMSLVP